MSFDVGRLIKARGNVEIETVATQVADHVGGAVVVEMDVEVEPSSVLRALELHGRAVGVGVAR